MSDFVKNDDGKLQWSLMPFEQLEDTVRVLMKGAVKYSRDNWKKCDDVNRYKDALMRHVTAYIKGETKDPEDNLSHLAHAICNCLFLQWFDDKQEKAAWTYAITHGLVDAETVKESEEAYIKTIEDKNGTPCRHGDYVMFRTKANEKKFYGMLLYDCLDIKGFLITSYKGNYAIDDVEWFELDHRPEEIKK